MSIVYTVMIFLSLFFGIWNHRLDMVTQAAIDGARQGITLTISLLGALCLWSGVMEVLRRSGAATKLAGLLQPLLSRLFPQGSRHPAFLENLSANVSANLLGLGNAATPYGIAAAKELAKLPDHQKELARLIVLNASSLQLLPTTIASVRATLGAQTPFDILPPVLLTSAFALVCGLVACSLLERRP